jgi:hypothetical protein
MNIEKIFRNNEEWVASKLSADPDYLGIFPKDRILRFYTLDVLIAG